MPRGGRREGTPDDPERAERLSLHRAILRSVGATEQQVISSRNLSAASFQKRFDIDARQYEYLKEHRLGRARFGREAVLRAWVISRGEGYWDQWYNVPFGGLDKARFRFDMFVSYAQDQGRDTEAFYHDLEQGIKGQHMSMKLGEFWHRLPASVAPRDKQGRLIIGSILRRWGVELDIWRAGDEGGGYWETP